MPLSPLVALLVTWELGQELRAPKERTLVPLMTAASLGGFGLVLMIASARWSEPPVPTLAIAGSVVYLLSAGMALVGVLRTRPRIVFGSAAVASALFLGLLFQFLLPALVERRSIEPLIAKAPVMASERPLVLYAMELPGLVWYLDRVPEKVREGDLPDRLTRGDRPLVVMDERDFRSLEDGTRGRLEEVAGHGKYRLFQPVANASRGLTGGGSLP